MAFTRSRNNREEYELEQYRQKKRYEYSVADLGYVMTAETPNALQCGFGVYATRNMPQDFMTRNAIDVENDLRGIGSSDMVHGSRSHVKPDNRETTKCVEFFKRPAPYVEISPVPCVNPDYQKSERPSYYE
tara:strand:- start:164 stop:556 length:393 start_codon:yes stop_codon:yes gene_type:complete